MIKQTHTSKRNQGDKLKEETGNNYSRKGSNLRPGNFSNDPMCYYNKDKILSW